VELGGQILPLIFSDPFFALGARRKSPVALDRPNWSGLDRRYIGGGRSDALAQLRETLDSDAHLDLDASFVDGPI